MNRRHTNLLAALTAMVLLLISSPQALAHSSLDQTSPEIGATVAKIPNQLRLQYSDPVTMRDGDVRVLDAAGVNYVQRGITARNGAVKVPVDIDSSGTYIVAWNAISDHGTSVSGSYEFHVQNPTPAFQQASSNQATASELVVEQLALSQSIVLASLLMMAATALVSAARGSATSPTAFSAALVVCTVATAGAILIAFDIEAYADLLKGLVAVTAIGIIVRAAITITGVRLLAMLGATALLIAAGATAQARPEPATPAIFEQGIQINDQTNARITIAPTVAGIARANVRFTDTAGTDIASGKARLRYKPTDDSLGYFKQSLSYDDDTQSFATDDLIIPFAGEWKFELTFFKDEYSAALSTFEVVVAPNPMVTASSE